jgi:hypothetical protein
MKAGDITALWREDVDDLVEPFLWSPEMALDYLNDAINEANRRSRLLVDSSTTAVCQVAVPTTGIAVLDPRVLFVRKVRFSGRLPLRRMNMQDLESCDPYWEDAQAVPYPSAFIPDWEAGKLRFYPPPSAQLTALLTVVRDPLVDILKEEDEPEIPARYHRSLRHWMVFRAYSKQDSEAADPKKAAQALDLFEQEFGKKSSAIDETWIAREQFEGDGTY